MEIYFLYLFLTVYLKQFTSLISRKYKEVKQSCKASILNIASYFWI